MIVLDTHVWVWWVHKDTNLPASMASEIALHEADGIGISAISCWEVAKLAEHGRLVLPVPVDEWMARALSYPGVALIELSPRIAIEFDAASGAVSQRSG